MLNNVITLTQSVSGGVEMKTTLHPIPEQRVSQGDGSRVGWVGNTVERSLAKGHASNGILCLLTIVCGTP